MVIVRFQGGLGNQLFQYATALTVADRLGLPIFFNTETYGPLALRQLEITEFNIHGRVLPPSMVRLISDEPAKSSFKRLLKQSVAALVCRIVDPQGHIDPRIARLRRPCHLVGYWQAEDYFTSSREKLQKQIVPRKPLSPGVESLLREIDGCNAIAVHVRRGDLITDPICATTVGALTRGYYERALSHLLTDSRDARLFVFAEDPEWAKANLPSHWPMTMVSGTLTRSAAEDLFVMSRCRQFVIANSTFSWWSAWLSTAADKRVIAPTRFFLAARSWEPFIVPSAWERIEAEFEKPPG